MRLQILLISSAAVELFYVGIWTVNLRDMLNFLRKTDERNAERGIAPSYRS